MTQNKSTSRIAAITGKLAVALATLLAPAILIAETINVTFDAALTNETGWVYSDIATDKDGNIYFKKLSSSVQSPTFSFNITSVKITLSCTSTEPSRILQIIPSSGEATNAASVAKASTKETQIFEFDKTDTARSFSIRLTGSSNTGNWYIYSAVISGVPIIDAPTNLQADDIKGTRFRLSWTNPENAVSNKIEISQVASHEESGNKVVCHTFDEFSNKGDTKDKTENIVEKYPELSGSVLLCYPTNSSGQIQISQQSNKGILVHMGLDSYDRMFMLLCLRRYQDDDDSMSIQWIDSNGLTNDLQTVSLSDNFTTEVIALSDVQPNAPIVFNAIGDKTKHRIIIDELSFVRDYSPASVSTNLVKTAFVTDSTTYSVRGLCPRTEYVAKITAFDAEGNESSPSEPLAVTTNGEAIPFSIRIQ